MTMIILRPDLEIKMGVILALIAAITHAIAGLLVKKISETESISILMLSMVVIMLPITFIPSIYVWTPFKDFNLYILLFTIAFIATLGNYCWTKALSMSKLTNLMTYDFSKLIFTTILGLISVFYIIGFFYGIICDIGRNYEKMNKLFDYFKNCQSNNIFPILNILL